MPEIKKRKLKNIHYFIIVFVGLILVETLSYFLLPYLSPYLFEEGRDKIEQTMLLSLYMIGAVVAIRLFWFFCKICAKIDNFFRKIDPDEKRLKREMLDYYRIQNQKSFFEIFGKKDKK